MPDVRPLDHPALLEHSSPGDMASRCTTWWQGD